MARVTAGDPPLATPQRLNWRAMQPLHTDDGVPLHVRHWGAKGQARGTVIVVHGLGEHLGRYEAVVTDLNAAHWHVAAYDHRGHGASGGARGRIPRDDSLLRDLSRVVDQVREMRDGPIVLLGHSMGGLVVSRFVVADMLAEGTAPSWHRRVDAIVMSSPALELTLRPLQRVLLGAMSALAPDVALSSGLDATCVSSDPQVVEAYRKDPLVHDRVTARLVRFMIDAGDLVRGHAAVWSMPTLLMWAEDDRCVAPSGSAAFAADAPREFVTCQPYAAFAHEIFNEPGRAKPIERMIQWLAEQFR